MSTQLNATRDAIRHLSTRERGDRSRQEVHGGSDKVGINTYADFESGKRWPRAKSLRGIESILGWKQGAIDEALASGLAPGDLGLAHMRGEKSFTSTKAKIQDFSNEEFFADLPRRLKEIENLVHKLETYTFAASDDLGGVAPDQIEDS